MLNYRLLPDHEGVRLCGHLSDFDALKKVLHDVAQRSPLIKDEESPFLALAYLLRKAYDNDPDTGDAGGILEAKVDWPCLLVTSRVLRDSLAFMDHGKHHQAATYVLEAVIQDALHDDFAEQGGATVDAWNLLSGNDLSLLDRMGSVIDTYLSWDAQKRKNTLAALLVELGAPWLPSEFRPNTPPAND